MKETSFELYDVAVISPLSLIARQGEVVKGRPLPMVVSKTEIEFATYAAKEGLKVLLIGPTGSDLNAEVLASLYARENNIACEFVAKAGAQTSTTLLFGPFREGGVVDYYPGANEAFLPKDVSVKFLLASGVRLVYIVSMLQLPLFCERGAEMTITLAKALKAKEIDTVIGGLGRMPLLGESLTEREQAHIVSSLLPYASYMMEYDAMVARIKERLGSG